MLVVCIITYKRDKNFYHVKCWSFVFDTYKRDKNFYHVKCWSFVLLHAKRRKFLSCEMLVVCIDTYKRQNFIRWNIS